MTGLTSPWVLELEHASHRAFISPISGLRAPYRLHVVHPNGERSLSVGLATMERAIESICTFVGGHGVRVPVGVRAAWVALAHKYDEPIDRYVH